MKTTLAIICCIICFGCSNDVGVKRSADDLKRADGFDQNQGLGGSINPAFDFPIPEVELPAKHKVK